MNRSRHIGKIKKRLEEAKNQWSRLAKVDFSHNESARVATDALLDGGAEAYRKALQQEGEVDFLSPAEAEYIQAHAQKPCCEGTAEEDPRGGGGGGGGDARSEGTRYPMCNSETGSEPALLHRWGDDEKPYLKDKSSATVYFQGDKANSIREIIRRCIHRTTQALAVIIDEFTDAEIFCDIFEAATKRNVVVYLLLDQSNLSLFSDMCEKLQIRDIHLKNISVRSVAGEVYCAKSGKKFSGRIQEKFIISDWRCVLSGSFSFTWLSGQVHRNIISKFTGNAVELFDEEFKYLYSISKHVMGMKPTVTRTTVLLRDNAPKSSLSDNSTPESANTTSEPLSNSSTNSVSRTKQTSTTSVYSSTITSTNQTPTSPVYSSTITSTEQPPTSPVYSSTITSTKHIPTSPIYNSTITSTKQIPTSPVYSNTITRTPLQRVNSFHGYTITSSQNGTPTQYYQRDFLTSSPQTFFNNGNVYRPVRNRFEDNCVTRFAQNWRSFSRPVVS